MMSEISALKESLHAQQQLLQKLYNELEAEREASASAVSEALSVILRLQCEKAAMKMEAEQYKRLSEEKIHHTEQSLAMTEDAIHRKEMEVAALDRRIQAYRHKLLTTGRLDLHPGFRNENLPSLMNGGDQCEIVDGDNVCIHDVFEMCGGDEAGWLTKSEKQSGVSQIKSTLNQVSGTSEIVEVERVRESSSRVEELKLLNEIKEKLELMIDEIKSLEVSKSSTIREESSFYMTILSEAMLHFWL